MSKNSLLYSLLGGTLIFASCTDSKGVAKSEEQLKAVPVVQLVQMDTVIYKEYIADIQSQKNVELRSRLTGFLNKIYIDEGAFVKKGQILFALNDEEYKADLAQARAALNSAKAEVKKVELEIERTKKLVEKNIVSSTEADLLQVQLRAAISKVNEGEAILNQASTKLSYTLIRAPFDGKIDRIQLKEGSLLTEGALITTISDLEHVNVYYNISESEYLDLATDSSFKDKSFKQDVKLILANGDIYPYAGVAELVENEFEASTGSISLRAQFNNPTGLLKHGASGRIGVPTSTGDLLFVHQKSVLEIQDKAYVYVVGNDNKVKMTPFKNGQRVGHYYIVEDGLAPNTKVVYEGVQSLRDGMQIQPQEVLSTQGGMK
ncbi:efflux RND transporter periplasmic adaptor subunit [Sphingobacterium rhinopitheci]|uniref:efflux RND transporter periplasmic adaptor subunit n=1 Tax=Sphingobacterium rhinopitheci TaxID=2781960 RepID=UPI001F52449E|nr:efflux RND transporter periplasmic adaptor subunit [Sphingobacterium rhinopitheci]MCI0919983.1 efflux RND transporter periplasmic adaptor subunit [Sphingobacterium rhinopitheci]